MRICPKCLKVYGSSFIQFCQFDGEKTFDTASLEGDKACKKLGERLKNADWFLMRKVSTQESFKHCPICGGNMEHVYDDSRNEGKPTHHVYKCLNCDYPKYKKI